MRIEYAGRVWLCVRVRAVGVCVIAWMSAAFIRRVSLGMKSGLNSRLERMRTCSAPCVHRAEPVDPWIPLAGGWLLFSSGRKILNRKPATGVLRSKDIYASLIVSLLGQSFFPITSILQKKKKGCFSLKCFVEGTQEKLAKSILEMLTEAERLCRAESSSLENKNNKACTAKTLFAG